MQKLIAAIFRFFAVAVLAAVSSIAFANSDLDEFHQILFADYPLHYASFQGDLAEVNRLLDNGANPNEALGDNAESKDAEVPWGGLTPLMEAASHGHAEVAKALLSVGANLNATLNDNAKNAKGVSVGGWTSLIWAAYDGHAKVVSVLLLAGANPNAADDLGYTALMEAASWGHAEVAEMLLLANASLNAATDSGYMALIAAASQGHAEVVELLLSAGANPNAVWSGSRTLGGTTTGDEYSSTALMSAAWRGHAEVINMLLLAGANPNAADNDGETALMGAASRGRTEVAKLLLSAGANPNVILNDKAKAFSFDFGYEEEISLSGQTALMMAAQEGHAEVVRALLSAGAYPNSVAKNGETALALANERSPKAETQEKANEYREIVRLLKEAGAEDEPFWSRLWSRLFD